MAILLAEDSSHTAGSSQQMEERFGMHLLWLPKRRLHLNPMDHLWRHGKAVISTNRQYVSIDEHVERFIDYLESLSAAESLRKAENPLP